MDDFEQYKNKKVLVTGGLGFIGSNLAGRLVKLGAEVTLVDALIPEYGGNWFNVESIKDNVSVVICDVREPVSMRNAILDKDYLFNLAGQTSHMDSMQDPTTDLEINCAAQLAILEACRSFNKDIKIVFASTRQIYGKPRYLPVDEQHLVQPMDVNGINKAAGEWYHILYSNVYGIRACALRLINTYGPHMRVKDARQTFLGIWVKSILQGAPIEVWGGKQLRDFNYIDDVVDAILLAAINDLSWGNIYNLGGDRRVSLENLARMLVTANGAGEYSIQEFPEERKKIDIGDYYSDFTRIRQSLGWEPKISLEAGLEKTLAFYQQNLDRYL